MPPTTHFDANDNSVHDGSNASAEMLNTPLTLPALLEVNEADEEHFLQCIFVEEPLERFHHRPTPAFLFYMLCRHRIASDPCPSHGQITNERKQYMRIFVTKVVERCDHDIRKNALNTDMLAFWLTNLSEFLNFCKRDRDLCVVSHREPRAQLKNAVEKCYRLLVQSAQDSVQATLLNFRNHDLDDGSATRALLDALSETVRVIRRNRLNPALTIQVFSQLFHFINMNIFNWLVSNKKVLARLSRPYGVRLRERLMHVNRWAEEQGLEQAAECHMDRIQQAVNLLIAPKTTGQIERLDATCYKLNSRQVRQLLKNFHSESNEESVSDELIDDVVAKAVQRADVIAMQDGDVRLLERRRFLPFLFPEDGYVAESLRGIPPEMSDFIGSLQSQGKRHTVTLNDAVLLGLYRLLPQVGNNGTWTVHMGKTENKLREMGNGGGLKKIYGQELPPMTVPRLTSTTSTIPTSSTLPPTRITETMPLTSIPGAATNNHQPAAASEVHTSVTGTSNRLSPPPFLVPIGTSGQEVHANAIPLAPAITERGSEPGGSGTQLQGPSVHPPPHRQLLSNAYTGNTSANSSSSTGSMSGDGSSSSAVQRPSSSTVAKAPTRAVSSVQPYSPLQTIHPAKRPRQEDSDNNPDDRGCSTSSSAVVPLKRPASPAHLNEGRAHDAPSAKAPRTEGIAASHRESNGFPPSSYVTPPVGELRVPHHPKGQLAAVVPKAPRNLGKDPLVEKYRSLCIRPIAKVMRNPLELPLEDKGERWTLKVLVADEYTAAPVFMVVGHELIMREFRFSVAECKVFRETNDSEKIKECKRNFRRLQDTLARPVLEVELSWDSLPLIVNATSIDELLDTA